MKIYHLCPSGAVWIFDQKEVESRERGEALFQKRSKPGDVLKIDIPGQDTIKITKLFNIPKPMSKESQLKKQQQDQEKERERRQKEYSENAKKFFEEYTILTDKYGIFLDAKLEYSTEGVLPKIVLAKKPVTPPAPEKPAEGEKAPEPTPAK